jgi:hypothetical protein
MSQSKLAEAPHMPEVRTKPKKKIKKIRTVKIASNGHTRLCVFHDHELPPVTIILGMLETVITA